MPDVPNTLDGVRASDVASLEPSTDLISGWDGMNVRSARIQTLDGVNQLFTVDDRVRRLLEQIQQIIVDALLAPRLIDETTDTVGAALVTSAIMYDKAALIPRFAFANVAASTTDAFLVAAPSNARIKVLAFRLHAGATATNVTFNTKAGGVLPGGAGVAVSELFACAVNGGRAEAFNPVGHFQTNKNEGLTVTTGAGSTVGVGVVYIEQPA